MTALTVAVTCIASDQNGNPVAGAKYKARLDQTEIYNGFIVPEVVEGVADANGVCVLQLWPNALGVAGSLYTITAVNPDTGKKFLNIPAAVPNNDCNLHQILVQAPYPTVDASQQALMAAQGALASVTAQAAAAAISSIAAENSAAAALASQNAASGSATAASGSATAAGNSATASAGSATTATTKADAAAASASSAATNASASATSAGTATTQAGIATTKAAEALSSAASAANSASTATAQASAASSSAASALTSASTATTRVGEATAQAGIAATQAANSATGAASAANSATATSADRAATAADRAQTGLDRTAANNGAAAALASQNAAGISATAAANSATAASASATTASTKAGEASTSAAAALISMNDAATSATAAAASATLASVKATAAENSATTAATQATAAEVARASAVAAKNSAVSIVTGGMASLIAAPDKLPMADALGKLDISWFATLYPALRFNDIGTPGAMGFGVGISPSLPAGYAAMAGTYDPSSANYGNYTYSDGSIMVWIPAFYFRLGHANNPTYGTYGARSISVKPLSAYPDESTANAESFYLHRAFVNAGANQLGFFRDKYDCSANGVVASSLPLSMPMVSSPTQGQIGFAAVTGGVNAFYGSISAAKSRGAKFFPESVFMADALCRLTEAHAQAATSSTYCAWYDAAGVKNFPKGNNNNALKDADDLTVTFTSAGSSGTPNMALTGSGSNLAKTTHNGQACGITDVNGNVQKINPGLSSIAVGKVITGATQTNPVVLKVVGHGRASGDVIQLLSAGTMTQLNSRTYTMTVVDVDHLSLDGVDGTAFSAFTTSGIAYFGTFYSLKSSVDIAAVTPGNTISTDHWGAVGIAAQFDAIALSFSTTYPNNSNQRYFGNGTVAVFDMGTANARARSMLGWPNASGMSSSGTNAMGLDIAYQFIKDELCMSSRGAWYDGTTAGSRSCYTGTRSSANTSIGFACASYL